MNLCILLRRFALFKIQISGQCKEHIQCKGLCASGQIDPPGVGGPYICLWSPNSIEKTIFELHWHENEVTSLIFSNCGRRLYSFGGDPHHMLAIWRIPEVRPGSDSVKLTNPLQTISTGKSRVPLSVGLHNSCSFVTFGTNLKFWNYETDGITQNLSIFGKFNTPKTVLCVAPCRDGTCLVSGDNGYIYWFTGNSCKQEQKISSHPVGCICEWGETGSYICSDDVGEMYYGNQTVSPIRLDMNNSKKINNSKSAAMAPLGGLSPLLLVGYDDKLILFDMDNKEIDRVVQCGHRGDIWGISHHPKLSFLASVGWDKNIMFWNIVKKIPSQTFRCEFKCQTVEFSPEGDLIAIGMHENFLQVNTFPDLNKLYGKHIGNRKERVTFVKWSRNGIFLAACSSDQKIYLYKISESNDNLKLNEYKVLIGHSSTVLCCMFSLDSKFICSNSRDTQILYWSSTNGTRQTFQSAFRDVSWQTPWVNIIGWPVIGAWGDPNYDITDINSICSTWGASYFGTDDLLALADDYGKVKLLRYPNPHVNPETKVYKGHSAHVTRVMFSPDNSLLFSAGGRDCAIIQWKLVDT
eukprot:GHVL01013858.1.p1 GENE.GHVL01013858.1~~GHVL01013858.1.p1  ORF type:complete len:579 (+),score=92.25 GHVL01013858.1:249-1985(+)